MRCISSCGSVAGKVDNFLMLGYFIYSCVSCFSFAGDRHATMWKCDGSDGTGVFAYVFSMEHLVVTLD